MKLLRKLLRSVRFENRATVGGGGDRAAIGHQFRTRLRLGFGMPAGGSLLEMHRRNVRLWFPRKRKLLREKYRLRGWHLPVQEFRKMHQLVLRLRRTAGLWRRLGRTMLGARRRDGMPCTSIQMW